MTAPHGERIPKRRRRDLGLRIDDRDGGTDLVLEAEGVDRVGVDHERVTGALFLHDVAELAADHRDEGPDRAAGSLGCLLAVDVVDQTFQADRMAGIGDEQRQDCPLLGTADRHRFAVVPHLDGPQDQQVHPRTIRPRSNRWPALFRYRVRHSLSLPSSASKSPTKPPSYRSLTRPAPVLTALCHRSPMVGSVTVDPRRGRKRKDAP